MRRPAPLSGVVDELSLHRGELGAWVRAISISYILEESLVRSLVRMRMLTSTEIVCVSGLSPWITMGWLHLVGMGWLVEDVFAMGGNPVRRTDLAECMSICRSRTNQPTVMEPYVGSGTIT